MEEHKKDPPPPSREEPGSREDSLGREPVEPGSNTPPSPETDSGPKGPRVWFYDPSQARKETAVKRQLQLGGRESRLELRLKWPEWERMWWPTRLPPLPPAQPIPSYRLPPVAMTTWGRKKPPTGRQAEGCANSAENQPCPQTEAGLPLQKVWKTGTTIPKPARRQLAQEAIPAEYPGTGIRRLPGSDPRLRRRIGQVRQARTMAPQPASQQRGGSSALH